MVELSGGTIFIDGLDISRVPLPKLRKSLSLVAQDPVLFSGTIRTNLDPFSEYTDNELWDVLRRSSMHDRVSGLPGQLDAEVSENGSNLSVGERQLLCLARALCQRYET